ncbi:MAG TPA: hypothetical protein ENJ09_07075 [Planctomycetes bacterium]|nr:hypothetical protein [Planctomycetota bacterium]
MSLSAKRAEAIVVAALFFAACGSDATTPAPTAPRNLILISLDTLRADHLGCYGHPRSRTPRIDALAADGVRFDQAMSAAPTTLASHSAIMTGTPPHTHGVPRNGFVLNDANLTLAEVLRDQGFTTMAVVGAFPLARDFGLAQGFQLYEDTLDGEAGPEGYASRRAAEVTDTALDAVDRWLADPEPRRAFLFVHYFDAHAPYTPPAPFDEMFRKRRTQIPETLEDGVWRAAGDHYNELHNRRRGHRRNWGVVSQGIPRRVYGRVSGEPMGIDRMLDALYLGEIAYLDQELGRLFDGLEERGVLDESVVLLTADHGETMWEHEDFWNHGLGVYETTVHVPLIVRAPSDSSLVKPGLVVCEPVSGIDIAPTALGLLGIAVPASMEGVDLGLALRGGAMVRGPIFSEATMPFAVEETTDEPWINAAKPETVRKGQWKFIRWNVIDRDLLFNLSSDPGERENLLKGKPSDADRSRARAMSFLLDAWRAEARPLPTEYRAGEDTSMQDALDALGYGGESDGEGE